MEMDGLPLAAERGSLPSSGADGRTSARRMTDLVALA